VASLIIALCLGVLLSLTACRQEVKGPPWCAGLDQAKVFLDVDYADGKPDLSHQLDLVVPTDVAGPRPLVVWIHGGAWLQGDKSACPGAMLVKDGYAVASINYRLSQIAPFPAQLFDCKAAIRWLRAHAAQYNLDGNRIGVWGQSAGGHLVALLGTTGDVKELEGDLGNPGVPSSVQAVCDWCGPTDLVSVEAQSGPQYALNFRSPDAPQFRLIGGKQEGYKEKLLAASPIKYVGSGNAPILILHGDKDDMVPYAQSEEFYRALKKAGVDATFITVKGAGHNFFDPSSFQAVYDFFKAKLKS
jgi:acetyl esterase/lipase